jgi:predicted nucleic acid-binding Zn ribbon protein
VTKQWTITAITIAIIVVVAIGATYVRGQVLEKQMIEEVTAQDESFYGDMPSAVSETQSEADKQALNEKQDADRKGGWGTFIVLAFIFIFLQFLGILFGYKWGFGGKESRLAWNDSHAFTTRESFVTYFKRKSNNIAKIAQGRLTELHKKLQQAAMGGGVDTRDFNTNTKSFLDYVFDAKHEHASHVASTAHLSTDEHKVEAQPTVSVKVEDSLKCPTCGNEIQKGAKFCPHCATSLESLLLVDPTCPTCGRHYPQGTKFCPEDATPLVSADTLKPTCVKCGKIYPEGTKFCSEDGGEVKVGSGE